MSNHPPLTLPAPRPASGRAGRGPARRVTPVQALAAAALAATVVGCAPSTPGPSFPAPRASEPPTTQPSAGDPSGLLLLAVADGGSRLSLLQPGHEAVALPVPDPATAAVVPMPDGSLVALRGDGRAFAAQGVTALRAGGSWQPLELQLTGALPARAIVFAATASPDGRHVAAIVRPPYAEGPSALLVIAPATGRAVVHGLPDESTGIAPAWVDADTVALVQRGRDGRTFVAVLSAATGAAVKRIDLRALAFGTSGDGGAVVLLGDDGRPMVGPTPELVELGHVPEDGPGIHPGDTIRGGVVLDEDGDQLAAVVDDVAGVTRVATFARVGDTWQPGSRIPMPPGVAGGWISWLR